MSTLFMVACSLFFGHSISHYLHVYWWGFVKDVFGVCAASGYKEAYALQCIPAWAGEPASS